MWLVEGNGIFYTLSQGSDNIIFPFLFIRILAEQIASWGWLILSKYFKPNTIF